VSIRVLRILERIVRIALIVMLGMGLIISIRERNENPVRGIKPQKENRIK